jgi:hypothetical protein
VDSESQVREVLLKDKFLTLLQIFIKISKSVAERMSVCLYEQELTNRREKDKRHHDLIAAFREGPT